MVRPSGSGQVYISQLPVHPAAQEVKKRHGLSRHRRALSARVGTDPRAESKHHAPTLSQQIRRLEEIIGAPLLQRRRDGLRLTPAGAVLLDASRTVLSLLDHGVNQPRQAAGLGRPRLRVVLPPDLPDALAVEAASALRSAASAADVDLVWIEAALGA